MTGLTESEHVVAAFEAGGNDYVTKPVRTSEVMARIAAHRQTARLMDQARSALDAFGNAVIAMSPQDGKIVWQTPLARGARRLIFSAAEFSEDEQWMIVLREESDTAQIEKLMAAFKLTQRESEVLNWLVKGKTNRDIGEILGTSPRTVNKHLEHVFVKLGVETRTSAAALAISKLHGSGRGEEVV